MRNAVHQIRSRQNSLVRLSGDYGMKKFGFEEAAWGAAKEEGRQCLIACAKKGQSISYSAFVREVRSITFEGPHDPRLAHFLGEISCDEARAGRGMLTALVVRKHGHQKPGPGFFELAKSLGRDTSDIDKCWTDEFSKVLAFWKSERS